SALAAIVGDEIVHKAGVKAAFDTFLKDAGAPKDPIEKALVEQLFLAHHRLAKLQVQADAAKTREAIKVLNAAVVRLAGEFRRLALAIRAYRLPPSSRNFNLIHQQNVATAGGQQEVQYV